MQPATREDTFLVQETLDGNQLSFQLLVERYQDRIFGIVRHYTKSAVEVEDIVQDTFLKVFRKLETFQHQSSFSTWLHRIAVNTALDFLKRSGRNPVRTVEDPELAGLGVDALSRINRGLWFFTYGLAVSLSDGLVDVSPDVARSYLNDTARSLIEWEQSQRIDVDPT